MARDPSCGSSASTAMATSSSGPNSSSARPSPARPPSRTRLRAAGRGPAGAPAADPRAARPTPGRRAEVLRYPDQAMALTADHLRNTFTGFFVERDHVLVPSASLIPHDPTVLFTVAGMVPFKPYFVGDETPPFTRATDSQKCVRAGGKHNDLDDVGRTARHLVFFEMLGNWSFGDYFKEKAIPWAWEYSTDTLGFDGDRIWITVHDSDDEAEQIWHDVVGVPMARIQRLGDTDNFWQMGETGP